MELRDLLGWLLLCVALFSAATGVWAAWYFAHHRVYARQLRRERRARREASVGRPPDSDSLARIPRQPFVDSAASPAIQPGEGPSPIARPGFQPDPTLTRYMGIFSTPAERDQRSFDEAARFHIQTDRQPRVSCEVVQAIWVDAVECDTLQLAPVARGTGLSAAQPL